MEISDKLRKALQEQKRFISEQESIISELESNDLINENSKLKKQLEEHKSLLEDIRKKYQETKNENSNLRVALREQIIDEKINILKRSKEKIELYFKDATSEYKNRLIEVEEKSKKRIDDMKNMASKELGNEAKELIKELDGINSRILAAIQQNKQRYIEQRSTILKDLEFEIDDLSKEAVSEEVMQKRIKQNDLEVKIGLNWLNKAGILLILLGVAVALQYTYKGWSNELKGIFAFLIGGVLLGGGEWLNQKGKDIFAKGLIGGGIGVLYYAIFSNYFFLDNISMTTAMILSVLVTGVSIILSLRYDSQTIGAFSLIGGYLPFVTFLGINRFSLTSSESYTSMGYLFILNLLILAISINKKWNITNYISFILNTLSLSYLVFNVERVDIAVIYSMITFAMYTAVTLGYAFMHKSNIKLPDILLLGANTAISFAVLYGLFDRLFANGEFKNFDGILALIFAIIYYGLGQMMNKHLSEEKTAGGLFYLTALTFAVLVIPFQFGVQWLAMGWLVEGVLATTYGFRNKLWKLEAGGAVILGLSIVSFIFADFMPHVFSGGYYTVRYFDFKYFVITAGTLYTLFMYLTSIEDWQTFKYTDRGNAIKVFKFFTLANVWIYLVYTANTAYTKFISSKVENLSYYDDFYKPVLFAFTTILVGYIISKISILQEKFVEYYRIFLYTLADIVFLGVNFFNAIPSDSKALRMVSIVILIAYNIFILFNIRDSLLLILKRTQGNLEIYPLFMGIFLLVNLTGILTVQFNLGDVNLLFSLLYLAMAFVYIIYGFKRGFTYIRRFGLGLSIFSLAKLFLYDLSYLNIGGKIVAYFGFGIMLLAISYIYQKLKNTIEINLPSIEKSEEN